VQAHEIGTTHVSVRFQSTQSYEIEVTTDAVSLVEKLMAMKGQPAVSFHRRRGLEVGAGKR
jgi:hypothetical protein